MTNENQIGVEKTGDSARLVTVNRCPRLRQSHVLLDRRLRAAG